MKPIVQDLRIVIELKKEADANGVLNYLYKNSDLQVAYNFNMVAIYKKRPTLMSLQKCLMHILSIVKKL